jgi:hypothetical protein
MELVMDVELFWKTTVGLGNGNGIGDRREVSLENYSRFRKW